MANGLPVLVSQTDTPSFTSLEQISFLKGEEGSFNENLLQELIHRTPGIIPVQDFYPHVRTVYSLGCEIPVDLGERQGFIDNLLITDDGHLILVETKLWRNPEALRDVVAQTLEYGQAISQLSLQALEARLQRADKQTRVLKDNESILGAVSEMSVKGAIELDLTTFEEALELNLRRGEILYLIAGDGIHPSVMRMAHWLDEKTASPFKFGLVEIRMFLLPGGNRVAIPRILVRTREISRHVVVIDVHSDGPVKTNTEVISEARMPGGGIAKRRVKTQSEAEPITSRSLFETIRNNKGREAEHVAEELVQQLETLALDCRATGYTLQYGITDHGEFYSLVSLNKDGLWNQPPIRLIRLLAPEIFLEYKRASNKIAPFYPDNSTDDPEGYTGRSPSYEQLAGKVNGFINIIDKFKTEAVKALGAAQG